MVREAEAANLAPPSPVPAVIAKGASTPDLSGRAAWICFALVAVVYVLFRIHTLPIPLDRDEGVFGYTAQRILEGGKPYLDAMDHKPPGVFYLYALALRFVPPTPSGVHLFLLVYNFLTLCAVAALLRTLFSSRLAAVSGAFCYAVFSASPAIQGFTASTEMLTLLPITLSLLCAVSGVRRANLALIFLSGVAGAAAFWIKQTALTAALFALVFLIARRITPPQRFRNALLWCAGAAAVSLAVCGYFYNLGLFSPFFYWSFTHNALYATQESLADSASNLLRALRRLLQGDFLLIGLGIAVALWKFRSRRPESWFVLGLLAFCFAGALPGLGYAHYYAEIAPAVAVASGWGLWIIAQDRRLPRLAFPILLLAITLTPLYFQRGYFFDTPESFSRSFFGLNPFPESPQVSDYLRARTTLDDRIFIFGSEPQILFEARRKSATPFVMIYPLTHEYPRYREFQQAAWRDIQASRPAYILIVQAPTSLAWDGKASLDVLDNVRGLVAKQYRLDAVMPVTTGVGDLVDAREQRPDFADLVRAKPNILVFRRAAAAQETTSLR